MCRPLPKATTTIKKLPVTNNLLKKRFLYDLYTDIEDQYQYDHDFVVVDLNSQHQGVLNGNQYGALDDQVGDQQ